MVVRAHDKAAIKWQDRIEHLEEINGENVCGLRSIFRSKDLRYNGIILNGRCTDRKDMKRARAFVQGFNPDGEKVVELVLYIPRDFDGEKLAELGSHQMETVFTYAMALEKFRVRDSEELQ